MPFSTFADLQTSVANFLKRSDLTSAIPDFITLAEAKFNRNLRLRWMEAQETITTNQISFPFPDNYLEMRSLDLPAALNSSTGASRSVSLRYVTPEVMTIKYSGWQGPPRFYTEISNQIQAGPEPDGTYTYLCSYFRTLTPLASGTNLLWQFYPDAYLYGALLEAAPYLKDDTALARWQGLYQQTMKEVADSDDRAQASGSALSMRAI